MKIIYGLASEGMGHAIRAKPIIEELSKKHDLVIATDNEAYDFFSKQYKTQKIGSFRIVFENGKVKHVSTVIKNLLSFPKATLRFVSLIKKFSKFNPDLVIVDFEPFTNYLALWKKKPIISIDNQHTINTETDRPGNTKDRMVSKIVTKTLSPKADHYLACTFFFPETKNKRMNLFYPVLRKELLNKKPKYKNYILVYLSHSDQNLIHILKRINQEFIIYGLRKKIKEENIITKEFNEKSFIDDLANAKALISNGGFNTISEALYLKKPVYSIPLSGHYEQLLNAHYIQKLGYGIYSNSFSYEKLLSFIKNIPKFKKNLGKYKKHDNQALINKINSIINEISSN